MKIISVSHVNKLSEMVDVVINIEMGDFANMEIQKKLGWEEEVESTLLFVTVNNITNKATSLFLGAYDGSGGFCEFPITKYKKGKLKSVSRLFPNHYINQSIDFIHKNYLSCKDKYVAA